MGREGMRPPRDDSRLAFSYVAGRLPAAWTEARVVLELAAGRFLHDNADYAAARAAALPAAERWMCERYGLHPYDARRACEEFVVPALRAALVENASAGGMPTPWPWQVQEPQGPDALL